MANSAKTEMTAAQKKEFDKQRASYFKGTIAVMVIYGTFILSLALIGIFSESGREFIFNQNFSFTVTFIGGTLLVITLMLIQIVVYKTPDKEIVTVDNTACPDFWELKKTSPEMLNNMNSSMRNLSSYYCQAAPANVGIGANLSGLVGIGTATTLDANFTKMVDEYNLVNGVGGTNINGNALMTCGRIYPEYMAFKDQKEYPDAPNTLRCKFISECAKPRGTGSGERTFGGHKVLWNSVCPSS